MSPEKKTEGLCVALFPTLLSFAPATTVTTTITTTTTATRFSVSSLAVVGHLAIRRRRCCWSPPVTAAASCFVVFFLFSLLAVYVCRVVLPIATTVGIAGHTAGRASSFRLSLCRSATGICIITIVATVTAAGGCCSRCVRGSKCGSARAFYADATLASVAGLKYRLAGLFVCRCTVFVAIIVIVVTAAQRSL